MGRWEVKVSSDILAKSVMEMEMKPKGGPSSAVIERLETNNLFSLLCIILCVS